jgi:Fe-S cluster assembly protein SufB
MPETQQEIDIDRSRYTPSDDVDPKYKPPSGLSEDLVREISKQKDEPDWMLQKRLKALELFKQTPIPDWGPDLSDLNLDEITYFVRPDADESNDWDEVPDDIKDTFDRLGIPQAERKSLAGAGAQYDSDVVYHNLQEELEEKGVIFKNMDKALQDHPELVKKYFMTQNIPINDHKFIMLHAAVWSGGTFIYVPKNTKVELPLQAYFRMNSEASGQFEHTLIVADEGAEVQYIEGCSAPRYSTESLHAGGVEIFVHDNARVRYYSIENWSKNTYNLNTKRALVDQDGVMEWINGNMGSHTTMLYPSSVLRGKGAKTDNLSVAYAGEGQTQDVGSKAIHVAEDTKSTITSKSISKDGGQCNYRGLVKVTGNAENSSVNVDCDALLIDGESESNTHPYMKINNNEVDVAHEATVGKIGDEEIFYLQSRGLDEEEAIKMVVSGFIEPIVKELPLEYAVELNKLIQMEMEGSVG